MTNIDDLTYYDHSEVSPETQRQLYDYWQKLVREMDSEVKPERIELTEEMIEAGAAIIGHAVVYETPLDDPQELATDIFLEMMRLAPDSSHGTD